MTGLFALRLASSPRRPGTGFASFGAFRSEMTAAGPAAQELLPLHLKVGTRFRDSSETSPGHFRDTPETTARVSLLPPLLPAASLLPALTAAALTAAALTAAAACAAGHGAACFPAHLV